MIEIPLVMFVLLCFVVGFFTVSWGLVLLAGMLWESAILSYRNWKFDRACRRFAQTRDNPAPVAAVQNQSPGCEPRCGGG